MAIATHSPGAVEWPVAIVMPAICGLQHRLLISAGAVYANTGSVRTFGFFDDEEVEEEEGEPLALGEVAPRVVVSALEGGRVGTCVMSQRSS